MKTYVHVDHFSNACFRNNCKQDTRSWTGRSDVGKQNLMSIGATDKELLTSTPVPADQIQIEHRDYSNASATNTADCPHSGFGHRALRSLALALGVTESLISVLVLDHNHLGDKGLEILATGLRR